MQSLPQAHKVSQDAAFNQIALLACYTLIHELDAFYLMRPKQSIDEGFDLQSAFECHSDVELQLMQRLLFDDLFDWREYRCVLSQEDFAADIVGIWNLLLYDN